MENDTDTMAAVSIVIPTRNGGETIDAVLDAIFRQKKVEAPEVVIVDSGSKDHTLSIAKHYPVTIIQIPPQTFNHGETRNHGIRKTKGEYLVLITQDAEPANEFWLNAMVNNFADPQVAGVYCRQIPRDDADVITKRRLNNWLTGRNERHAVRISDWSFYETLHPMEKYVFCNFDNVCSCIRRTVWEKIPFEKTYFAEDIGWSKQVLEAGYTIVYEPEAAVYHSHNRSVWYEYERTYVCHRRLFALFALQTIPSFRNAFQATLRNIAFEGNFIWKEEKTFLRKLSLLCKLPLLSVCSVFGQYLGARDEKRRRKK